MLYRAIVTRLPKSGTVQVFFVDIGLADQVSVQEIYEPSPAVAKIPVLSIRSCLDGLPDTPDAAICDRFHKVLSNRDLSFVATIVRQAVEKQTTYISLAVCQEASSAPHYSMLDYITSPCYEQCSFSDGSKALVAFHDKSSDAVFLHLQENLDLVSPIEICVKQYVLNYDGNCLIIQYSYLHKRLYNTCTCRWTVSKKQYWRAPPSTQRGL